MKCGKAILLLLITSFVLQVTASDLNKAFKYLNTGDYPNALRYLQEAAADEPDNVAVNFGLAKFYSLKDNSLYNIDSANIYIKKAAAKTPLSPDDKQTKKYLALGVRDYTIQTLQQDINRAAYAHSTEENTVESLQHFIDNYTDKGLLSQAVNTRNQLAFIRARGKNDPVALDEFMKKYPGAAQAKDAKDLYEKLLYEQTTADKTYLSYKAYLDQYPNGAYAKEAKKNYQDKLLEYYNNRHDLEGYTEFLKLYKDHPAYSSIEDSVYHIVTKSGSLGSYSEFINRYNNNRNVAIAWDMLYVLYTADASVDSYKRFAADFPNYPNKARIQRDIDLAQLNLKPFQQGEKWGYAVQPTPDSVAIVIQGEYEEAFPFSSGLAAVRIKPCGDQCIYFYIDKNDMRAIARDFNFAGDFDNGQAIVGIGNCDEDSCKYGMIDKLGRWVIPPVYDEFNEASEGLYLVSRNEKYGFINRTGEIVISLKYANALSFSQGVAAVLLDSNWFFVDRTGKQIFMDYFHDVSSFKDSLCAVTKDGSNWGYIDMSGTFAIPPVYEAAEDFDSAFAIVSKKEKDPKHKGLFISQRYRIDKAGNIVEKLTAPKASKKKTSRKKGRSR